MAILGLAGIFMLVLIFMGIVLIPEIFFALTLQKAINRCSPENRTITPGMAWLILIPLFNLVWNFILVKEIAATLEREFRKRNVAVEPSPGKNIGFAWCILAVGTIIPLLGILSVIGAIVCWILYWAKIAGFSAMLAVPHPHASAQVPA